MRRRNAECGPLLSWDESRRVGAEVRRLRKAAGLLQYDIAHAAGVSAYMVSRLERGRHRWRERDAAKAAAELGTALEVLLAGGPS